MSESIETPEEKARRETDNYRRLCERERYGAPKGGWNRYYSDLAEHYRIRDVVLGGLTNRAKTILQNCDVKSKEQAKQDIMSGKLDLAKVRNCGKKSQAEIFNWLGLLLPSQKAVQCPCCQAVLVYNKGELFHLETTGG